MTFKNNILSLYCSYVSSPFSNADENFCIIPRDGSGIYRPHPKDREGNVFTGVCLLTSVGGGYPVVLSLVLSKVLSWGIPPGHVGSTPQDRDTPRQDRGTLWIGIPPTARIGVLLR